MKNLANLVYWINERDEIRKKKERGEAPPWSKDRVFQTTYFCNVRREDDKVTKYIRGMYSSFVQNKSFELNIILSRFLNWPPTLEDVGYLDPWDGDWVKLRLNMIKNSGRKVWGNAYVVTTHGIAMDKIDYLVDRVMPSVESVLPLTDQTSCAAVGKYLQNIEGISTFMSAQVVADLKNTEGHPLRNADDWWTFALPGPGSRRGMDWLVGEHVPDSQWHAYLMELQARLTDESWLLCAQDIQNTLCEFDKWCRVTHGTGRSKRSYHGT